MSRRHPPVKIGDRFERLTVIAAAPPISSVGQLCTAWRYRCECGVEKTIRQHHVYPRGMTKSCGCYKIDRISGPHPERRRHGAAGVGRSVRGRWPEYRVWSSIVQGCCNPKHFSYATLGARGIRMSVRWRRDFAAFLKDVGRRPEDGMALLRKDKKKGFFPGNVHWVEWRKGKAAA